MKRVIAVCVLVLFLTGCNGSDRTMGQFIDLRNRVLRSEECKFMTEVTADYGDSTYSFQMECIWRPEGDMVLTVTAPETISGITARISKDTGQLIFDDKSLIFALVADGQITPVCGPWLLMEALTGGYINNSGKAEQGAQTRVDDSFSGVQYSMDVWTYEDSMPYRAEIIWDGRRILSIDIDAFTIV